MEIAIHLTEKVTIETREQKRLDGSSFATTDIRLSDGTLITFYHRADEDPIREALEAKNVS